MVLDRLSPSERVAFVLHDSFGFEFPLIASMLDTTPVAARKLASRARAKVGQPAPGDRLADWEVVDAFLAAARTGEFERLLELLAPDVVVLDRNMPDAGDADAINLLRAQLPLARLLVLASKFDPHANSGAPVLGACTVLPRSTSAADLVAAIETAFHSPSVPITPRNAASLLNPPGSDLTQRERSLLATARSARSWASPCRR